MVKILKALDIAAKAAEVVIAGSIVIELTERYLGRKKGQEKTTTATPATVPAAD